MIATLEPAIAPTAAPKPFHPTWGGDPEVMIFDKTEDRIVSAMKVLPGHCKKNPVDLGDGIAMYHDNVLLEFRFPPQDSAHQAIMTISRSFNRIQEYLGPRYRLMPKSAHMFPSVDLQDPSCWEIGCMPNTCAYEEKENPPGAFHSGVRTGSFHIHLGNKDYLNDDNNGVLLSLGKRFLAVKLLDAVVGCASVLLDHDETSRSRRAYYGKAGEHRPTDYGVEWRVLGNYFLRTPELTYEIFSLVNYCLGVIGEGREMEILSKVSTNDVRTAINECDKNLAASVINSIELPDGFPFRLAGSKPQPAIINWQ